MMKSYKCPLCNHDLYTEIHSVMDHTVSSQMFKIVRCVRCAFLYTHNPPSAQDIGRYYVSDAYISHTDSNSGMFNKVYQFVRKFSIVSKRRLISRILGSSSGSLLDYGCGTGSFLHYMKINGWNVSGLEVDSGARLKSSQLTGIDVKDVDALSDFQENSFDVITLWHVLEHVHELHPTLDQFYRILKKDGLLIIAVPNHTSHDAEHYGKFWAAYDVPRHLYHFSPSSIKDLLHRHQFKLIKTLPMWFDAFYVSMLSEQYKYGSARPISGFLVGLLSNIKAVFYKQKCSSLIYIAVKDN